MNRLTVLAVLASLFLAGCGGTVQIGAAFIPGTSIVNGTVSVVQLGVVSGSNGTSVQVTVVTLLQVGMAQTFTFCGAQAGQFPLNTSVSATFKPGTTCGTLVSVSVAG